MANILVPLLVTFIEIHNIYANNLGQCVQENSCVCNFNEYSLVNISNILENKQPPYLVDAEGNSTYYFSGCKNALLNNKFFSVS